MNLTLAYRGHSTVRPTADGLAITLSPDLRRDRVAFDAMLRHPVRFRESVGALHDVVVCDLRRRPKDRSAYESYLAAEKVRESRLRREASAEAAAELIRPRGVDLPALEARYKALRSRYWQARDAYAAHLSRHDPALWRALVPCDPVVTVAPDVLFFEGFSADESSYGCLTVDRDAFTGQRDVALGTTNVDYSWDLYEHFQSLRSYRPTRFLIDPGGFEVRAGGGEGEGYREEKIDLPPGWLRGFMQVQAAMSLPATRVPVSREGLYAVLAFLARHRATKGPRAVRFEMIPGRPTAVVLEPWEQRIVLHDNEFQGPRSRVVRVWGRDRLRLLARLLPLADEIEVYLLDSGLPSFWSVRMGEMRFLMGLSGWSANDWTGPVMFDQLAPPADPSPGLLADIAACFRSNPTQRFGSILSLTGASRLVVAAALHRLALLGLVTHDLHAAVYRWRQVMPVSLSLEQVGQENPETAAVKKYLGSGLVHVARDDRRDDGLRVLEGKAGVYRVSLLLDADGRMLRGKCRCSHHFTGGLRRGPCRHLQALRNAADARERPRSLDAWFTSMGLRGAGP